jgi:hypothetical protein
MATKEERESNEMALYKSSIEKRAFIKRRHLRKKNLSSDLH